MDLELYKTAALFLAVFIPLVTAIFSYRKEERRAASKPSDPTMIAIGGAIATKEEGLAHTEALAALADAVRDLSELVDGIIRRNDRRAEILERGVDELAQLRRCVTDLTHHLKSDAQLRRQN